MLITEAVQRHGFNHNTWLQRLGRGRGRQRALSFAEVVQFLTARANDPLLRRVLCGLRRGGLEVGVGLDHVASTHCVKVVVLHSVGKHLLELGAVGLALVWPPAHALSKSEVGDWQRPQERVHGL